MPESENQLLFASVLLEEPASRSARQLGKTQISSLLRYFFNGEIVVWRNFSEVLYPISRTGVYEFDFTPSSPLRKKANLEQIYLEAKLQQACSLVEHASRYSWTIFADNDVLALRNWDHLFENQEADLLISKNQSGFADPGFFAIRSSRYADFVEAWKGQVESSLEKNQSFLQTILDSGDFSVSPFEKGEVVHPFEDDTPIREILEAAVVSLTGGTSQEKNKLSFALHMMRVFGDEDGVFLDLMES